MKGNKRVKPLPIQLLALVRISLKGGALLTRQAFIKGVCCRHTACGSSSSGMMVRVTGMIPSACAMTMLLWSGACGSCRQDSWIFPYDRQGWSTLKRKADEASYIRSHQRPRWHDLVKNLTMRLQGMMEPGSIFIYRREKEV